MDNFEFMYTKTVTNIADHFLTRAHKYLAISVDNLVHCNKSSFLMTMQPGSLHWLIACHCLSIVLFAYYFSVDY